MLLSEQKYTRNRFESLQALRLPPQNIRDKTKPASSRQENGRMQASLENIRQKTCRLEAVASPQSAGCLLLRSHSLITLFVIFRTASASSWESSYLYANFVCPFKTLTNCSLDLPSGSLFAQKHLWNGVMFVIKIVLGVMGLMPRTKAS